MTLILVFFFTQSSLVLSETQGPQGKTKKSLRQKTQKKIKRHSARTTPKKNKIHTHSKKNNRSRSVPKAKKVLAPSRLIIPAVKKESLIEIVVRSSIPVNSGSLQELVENEIIRMKAVGHLLPADQISLQVFDLNEKKILADINGNEIRNAASLIKLFVMLAVYDSIARQELQETPEIEHQLYRMIAVSDNGATNYLIRRLGRGDALQGIVGINALMRKMGFTGSHLRELIPDGGKTYANQTTAADTTLFFRLLYEQKLVSPQYSQKMNDILLKSIHDRIRTHQIKQDGVAVADKTGYVRGLNGDCGIVYLKGLDGSCHDYILSIIIENRYRPSNRGWGKKKSVAIRYLSDRIYQNLKNGQGKT